MKRRIIRKAAVRSGFACAYALADEARGVQKPLLPDVGVHGAARLRLEKAHEVITAEIDPVCQRVHGKLPAEVFVYV